MISISILTYNRCEILIKLLGSLSELNHKNIEIIVVDNNSVDNTEREIQNKFPEIKYIRTQKNIGVGARNIGIKTATNPIVITLDDDVFGITDEDINILLKLFSNRVNLAAASFKVVDGVNKRVCNWVHHYDVDLFSDKEFRTYEITEGAVAFRKEALAKVGFYNDAYFIAHEGPDLALRLLDTGYDVIYFPRIRVVHHHAESGRKPWYSYYYNTRNQLYLAVRKFPLAYSIKYLSRGLASMLVYSIRDGFVYYWFKAVKDGFLAIPKLLRERKTVNRDVMKLIYTIEKSRPGIAYYIRNRLLRRNVRL